MSPQACQVCRSTRRLSVKRFEGGMNNRGIKAEEKKEGNYNSNCNSFPVSEFARGILDIDV